MMSLLLRDLKLSVRAGGGALIGVLFFMTVVAVIPFGVGPDLNLLSRIGPAIVWIGARSEEHTSELQSLMRISYAVFCLKKKKQNKHATGEDLSHKTQDIHN